MINFSNYRSILCLNGALPSSHFFDQVGSLPIIAADGAANRLWEMNISPTCVIGDLDSLDMKLISSLKILHKPDQDSCDFEKSLLYLKENNLLPAIIVGINGGYLDHVLNNVNLFLNTDNLLYAPPIVGFSLTKNQKKFLPLPLNTKISLFGIPSASVSTQGLYWELTQYQLAFPGKTSCFNRSIESEVSINIHSGTALILIYYN